MSTDSKRAVVFGSTGAIGLTLVEIMSRKHPSWEIIAVSRSSDTPERFSNLTNVTMATGDAYECNSTIELCQNASIVYCIIGLPWYEAKAWAKYWPTIVDNLLESTSNAGARLVFCDNLYAYGPGTNISPTTTTVEPNLESKPAIRALLRQKLEARMKNDPSSIVVVGGADFFGPGATSISFLGDFFWGALLKGKNPLAIGSADALHSFCYAPDFANAIYVASINDSAYGKFWICPHAIQGKTFRQIATDAASIINEEKKEGKKVKVSVMPGWLLRSLAIFDRALGDGFLYEMKEMLQFWTDDYTVDDSAFIETFGIAATPYEAALSETAAFFRDCKQ